MIVLNISTNTNVRHDIGIILHKRGWCWGDGENLIRNPLEATFKDNPYMVLKPEDKTIRQVITITKKLPTRTEIIAAGHIIIDVHIKDWIF